MYRIENKCIIEKNVRQVVYLPELYEDARFEKKLSVRIYDIIASWYYILLNML
jgi:hypothetical protein